MFARVPIFHLVIEFTGGMILNVTLDLKRFLVIGDKKYVPIFSFLDLWGARPLR
jgi:hypothetical protein